MTRFEEDWPREESPVYLGAAGARPRLSGSSLPVTTSLTGKSTFDKSPLNQKSSKAQGTLCRGLKRKKPSMEV